MIYETVRAPLRVPPSRAYIQCELDRLRKGERCNLFCPPTPDHSSTILAELIKSDASDDALCARKHEILLPIVRVKATAYDEFRPYRAARVHSLPKHELEALTCGYHRDKTRTIGAIRREIVSTHFEDWLREACGQTRHLSATGLVRHVAETQSSLVERFAWPPPLTAHGLCQNWLVLSCAPSHWVGHDAGLPEGLKGTGTLVRAIWELSSKPWEEACAVVSHVLGQGMAITNYFHSILRKADIVATSVHWHNWQGLFDLCVERGVIEPSGMKHRTCERKVSLMYAQHSILYDLDSEPPPSPQKRRQEVSQEKAERKRRRRRL